MVIVVWVTIIPFYLITYLILVFYPKTSPRKQVGISLLSTLPLWLITYKFQVNVINYVTVAAIIVWVLYCLRQYGGKAAVIAVAPVVVILAGSYVATGCINVCLPKTVVIWFFTLLVSNKLTVSYLMLTSLIA
jgi:hypothetical protein